MKKFGNYPTIVINSPWNCQHDNHSLFNRLLWNSTWAFEWEHSISEEFVVLCLYLALLLKRQTLFWFSWHPLWSAYKKGKFDIHALDNRSSNGCHSYWMNTSPRRISIISLSTLKRWKGCYTLSHTKMTSDLSKIVDWGKSWFVSSQ